ncbi:9922_t:CDS:2, partial [Acaulospora morrowiae]
MIESIEVREYSNYYDAGVMRAHYYNKTYSEDEGPIPEYLKDSRFGIKFYAIFWLSSLSIYGNFYFLLFPRKIMIDTVINIRISHFFRHYSWSTANMSSR